MAPAPRYLIRAATLMLGAVRMRVAGADRSRDVTPPRPARRAAGPRPGVRSAACPPTDSVVSAAACGTPGRGRYATLEPCPCGRDIPDQKRMVFRHGLTT